MNLLSILCLAILAVTLAGTATAVMLNIKVRLEEQGKLVWLIVACCFCLIAVVIARPHEDTFAGLDNSGYRLMARAIQAGRPIHSADRVLLEAPCEIRNWFMLLPHMDERNTRDRSYLIKNLDSCETEPFFYPLLPLCAAGFGLIVPGDALDYLIPFLGLIFIAVFLSCGAAYGRIPGVLFAVGLLIGSPLPAWLLRGFYVESAASVLIGLTLLCWLTKPQERPLSLMAYLSLGLAVSFHPSMIVLSLPSLLVMVITFNDSWRRVAAGLALFGAGLLVMVLMFTFACTPYGTLEISAMMVNFGASASHRITLSLGLLFAVFAVPMIVFRAYWITLYGRMRVAAQVVISWLLIIVGVILVAISALWWSQKSFVVKGLAELGGGIGVWFGVFLGILALPILLFRENARGRVILGLVLLALPVFAYLKGAEQMGLWSQRRLLPVHLAVIIALLPAIQWIKESVSKTGLGFSRRLLTPVITVVLLALALFNPVRWPAPYTVRCELGSWKWVESIRAKIGKRLIFFDYYPYSVPFAVMSSTRALGLGEKAQDRVGDVFEWLGRKATEEEVWCATAYENPGIEDGVALRELFKENLTIQRVKSKGALPAEKARKDIVLRFMRACPVDSEQPPVLNKIFDRGPLALRGPWGRADIPVKLADSKTLPACWSREGSGIIGPVPPPGGSVRIRVDATAERHDGLNHQTLRFHPPWDGEALSLTVSNSFTSVSGELSRPSSQTNDVSRTGIYRIYADTPYSPRKVGITGFSDDLGALIHLIRMELVQRSLGSGR